MKERDVLFDAAPSGELPVLTAMACPYPHLAEQDRSICAMERLLFSEVVGQPLRLAECRLDGANCCTFELSAACE
jgi:predicted ArsR family transcriptional regulator